MFLLDSNFVHHSNQFFSVANRESLSAPFIRVMAFANLVQIANLTILWETICMELPLHRQMMHQ
jgi:hypothetical protein